MLPFRDNVPTHQKDREECEKYSSYLDTLKIDFNERCGYCNDSHSYRIRSFAIDHFVPRNPKDFTHTIKPNHYFNLIYACNYCNSAKSNKWPTRDATIHNDGLTGFVMPTDAKYDELFCRDMDGSILPKSNQPLQIYIIDELNLKNPIHSLMWRFEKIISLEAKVRAKLSLTTDDDLKNQHYDLMQEIINIVRNIFSNNA